MWIDEYIWSSLWPKSFEDFFCWVFIQSRLQFRLSQIKRLIHLHQNQIKPSSLIQSHPTPNTALISTQQNLHQIQTSQPKKPHQQSIQWKWSAEYAIILIVRTNDFMLDGISMSKERDLEGFYKKFVESRFNGVKWGKKKIQFPCLVDRLVDRLVAQSVVPPTSHFFWWKLLERLISNWDICPFFT